MTSRRKRARAGRKAGRPVTSAAGEGLVPSGASRLLSAAADALNACEASGLGVKLAHGAVITEAGYVFRVGPDDAPWAVRTRLLTEFPVVPGDDELKVSSRHAAKRASSIWPAYFPEFTREAPWP